MHSSADIASVMFESNQRETNINYEIDPVLVYFKKKQVDKVGRSFSAYDRDGDDA